MADRTPHPARHGRQRTNHAILLALWIALAAWPFLSPNNYVVSVGGTFLINLLLVSSLNLLVGFSGQVSLAHGAFFGLGAYASGILSAKYGISPWLGLLAAPLVAALVAALVGVPTLRMRGHYLAMATLGLNVILSVFFVGLFDFTGGPNGLIGVPSFSIGRSDLGDVTSFYFVAWAIVGLVMLGLLNLVDSRAGRALRALAASEVAASCMGIPIFHYKIAVFSISAAIAGVAGSLYVHQNNFASPETFSFFTSVLLLVMTAVGGFGRYWGGFFGALLFTFVPELTKALHDVELLIFGTLMIVVVGFLPGGLAAGADRIVSRLRARNG